MSLPSSGRPVLLHIVPTASAVLPDARNLAAWCDEAGLIAETCPHVYLAIPRILRNQAWVSGATSAPSVVGVVVFVDDLTAAEFEFFTLIQRIRRDLPVYAYGPRSADKVVQALQAGARGLVTREVVMGLGSRQPVLEEAIESPAQPRPILHAEGRPAVQSSPPKCDTDVRLESPSPLPQPESKPAEPDAPTGTLPAGSAPPEPVSLEDADEGADEPAPGVRVPWLRYNGGPERTAPNQRIKPSSLDDAPTSDDERAELFSSPCSMSEEYEPLLTEQELAALLGDDFGDVTTAKGERPSGDGEKPGGKTR